MTRVLAVDDDVSVLKILRFHLERAGYSVTTEESSVRGLERLENETFDLFVFDVTMPGLDGLALCETVRKKGLSIPVLFLSGRNSSIDVLAGYAAGAQAYLTKPFQAKDLLAKVEYALRVGK